MLNARSRVSNMIGQIILPDYHFKLANQCTTVFSKA